MRIHCILCEKTFPTKIALKHHSNIQSCHLCGQCYFRPSALKRHIEFTHKVESNKYECKECGLFFKNPSNFKEHSRKHDKSIQFPCRHCDRKFLQKKKLEHHIMRFHLNECPFKCDICGKCYVTKSNLTDHIRSKHTKTTFDCDKCKRKFESQSGLREHKYTHDGYPYNCPLCSVGITSRFKMKQHLMRKHKGALTEEEFNIMFPICK
ncbi:zinc finger protein 37-like [Episyrphus balteatus]|uniref:zinc finger protein 37-like n=1 Tax=Episyrphus balteatus TaxID=286459 RepID=UPI0024860540|nr:zinc finger protein 37-like [Episyrphus balteatus]